jgi:tetratricopeptide (TPR) repeat protein
MIDADRVLRPLKEAAPAIEKLDTYESPAVLAEALRATWLAVDRSLRLALRNDSTIPDAIRMNAMSSEMSIDDVITELRRRDIISMSVAGRTHELAQAVTRGSVRATDADNALDLARTLEQEIVAAAGRSDEPRILAGSVLDSEPEVGAIVEVSSKPRRKIFVALGLLALLAAVLAAWLFMRTDHMEEGIAAFREGRMDAAEQHFRAVLADNSTNVTALIYLGRLLRQEEQYQESAELLRRAAVRAPNDAGVRRELGYLFLALGRAGPAAEQFQRAVELEPDDAVNWIGVIEANVRAGDTAAAREWLGRAPAEAQARFRR